jgi:hypothetical protein
MNSWPDTPDMARQIDILVDPGEGVAEADAGQSGEAPISGTERFSRRGARWRRRRTTRRRQPGNERGGGRQVVASMCAAR